jgi:hypothetical protein
MGDEGCKARFYLPVWNGRSVRFRGNANFPLGGAWVGVLPDGSETVDFGLKSEALGCATYFARIHAKYASRVSS